MIRCSGCGKEMEDGAGFCSGCGNKLVIENVDKEDREMLAVEDTVADENERIRSKTNKGKTKKWLWISAGVLAIILALAALLIIKSADDHGGIFSPNETQGSDELETQPTEPASDYIIYLKDEEGFISDLIKEDPAWQITSKLIDGEEISESQMLSMLYVANQYVHLSMDGKLLFYPDKLDVEDEGINLYCRDLTDPTAEPVKIDSDVQSFDVNAEATCVTYTKGQSGTLYQYSVINDTKEKIATNVEYFRVTADGTKLGYVNSESNLYLKYTGQEAEKIASDVTSVEYLNDDLTVLFYIKDDALYKQVEGEDRIKLAKDVYSVVRIYESGEVYYLKEETAEKSLLDCIKDDMKEADDAMEYPVAPTRPYRSDYEAYEQYEYAYELYWEAYASYESAVSAYQAKVNRDEMRYDLSNRTVTLSDYTLYYYDGTQEIKLTETVSTFCTAAANAPVVAYRVYDRDAADKLKFSEIYDIDLAANTVLEKRDSVYETYLCVGANAEEMEGEEEQAIRINDAGTVVYYLEEVSEDGYHAEQYRVYIKDGKIQQPELSDHDVYIYNRYFDQNDKFVYFKDVNDAHGEMYIDQEKIDYDVYLYSIWCFEEENKVIYFTDMNSEKAEATLKIYQDGVATKIADDVHANNYVVTADGRILYLQDYSREHYRGELYEWNNGEKRKLDDDVTYILQI